MRRLAREANKLKGEILSISNSSDPYPTLEAEAGLMRGCLGILSESDCRIQIVTKSPLVVRDIDFLRRVPSMVSLTVTTDDDHVAGLIEPHAPPPSARLRAVETLVGEGIPVCVRIDPIIPFVNDAAEGLVCTLASLGVRHITSSTFKVKPDAWRRFRVRMPEVAERLKSLYFEQGARRAGCVYLPEALRLRLMENVGRLAKKWGMKFGTCREGFNHLNTEACDGSWLLKTA